MKKNKRKRFFWIGSLKTGNKPKKTLKILKIALNNWMALTLFWEDKLNKIGEEKCVNRGPQAAARKFAAFLFLSPFFQTFTFLYRQKSSQRNNFTFFCNKKKLAVFWNNFLKKVHKWITLNQRLSNLTLCFLAFFTTQK